jgi:[ribosomal protein S18]-alanine N-acetyltransferase
MPKQAGHGPAPELLVRTAREVDFHAIARIQRRCPETAQWPLGDYSGFPLLLALKNREPVGFCSWRQNAPDEAEILNIAVDPAARRHGVGSALLDKVSELAEGTIFLEVATTNSAARALYSKHGWREIGVRSGYYNQGTVDAVVMKKCSW